MVKKTDAAIALDVSKRTVERYIADGKLTAVRLSSRATRITQSSLDALLGGGSE